MTTFFNFIQIIMKKMFDWIIKMGTTVLDTKKELLAKLYVTQNIGIPLERLDFVYCIGMKSCCNYS